MKEICKNYKQNFLNCKKMKINYVRQGTLSLVLVDLILCVKFYIF